MVLSNCQLLDSGQKGRGVLVLGGYKGFGMGFVFLGYLL